MLAHRAAVPPDRLGDIVRTFLTDGAVQIHGAIDKSSIALLRAAAERTFAERETLAQRGQLPAHLAVDYTRRFVTLEDLGLVAFAKQLLGDSSFRALGDAYLGKLAHPAGVSHVRWISPHRSDAHLPFHQDETILRRKLLNVWIPFSPCGVDAPGLQVVRGSWGRLLDVSPPPGARYAVDLARIDELAILREFRARALWNPALEVGDAMVFSGDTAHRTYAHGGMTRDRMSLELRLV